MIEVHNLTKCFGATKAVDDISFHIGRGEIVGFLGPNGAGKTTTLRMISSFLPPTSGTVAVDGIDVRDDPVAVRRKIGYLPENVAIYPEMRVSEYLRYRAKLKGIDRSHIDDRTNDVLSLCGLKEVARRVMGQLSKGYKQRVGMADTLLHQPDLLILDEPAAGLDPRQIRHVRHLIRSMARRRTVLISSHILSEIEMICDKVLIIRDGKIISSGSPRRLAGMMSSAVAEIRGPAHDIEARLRQLPDVQNVTMSMTTDNAWHRFSCECTDGRDIRPEIFTMVSETDWQLRELTSEKKHLEDVFIELTSDTPDGPDLKQSLAAKGGGNS